MPVAKRDKPVGAFIGEVPEFSVADEVLCIRAGELVAYMPLPVARRAVGRAQRVMAEYEAKRAEVVPIRKRRRDHAARS